MASRPTCRRRRRPHRAQSLLDSAAWLYPGTEVDVLKGRLAIGAEARRAQAVAIERRVTAREPLNVDGWV